MAATTEVGRLSVNLTAETAAFTQDLQKARVVLQRSTAEMQRNLGSLGAGFQSAAKMASTFLATLGVAAVVGFAKSVFSSVGSLGEMGEQAGVTAGELAGLQLAALQGGAGIEQLQGSLEKLTRKLGEAASGNDDAIKDFRALGVSVLDAGGAVRPTIDVLRDVADRVQNAGSAAERGKIAFDAFGRAGQKLIPMLSGGAAGLDKALGSVDAAEIKRISEAFDKLGDDITLAMKKATLGTASLIQQWRDFASDKATLAVIAALVGGRIAGLPGAAVGAAGGFALGSFLKETDAAAEKVAELRQQIDTLTRSIEGIGESSQPIMAKMKRDFEESRALVQLQLDAINHAKAMESFAVDSARGGGGAAASPRLPQGNAEIKAALQRQVAVQAFIDSLKLERDALGNTETQALRLRMEREKDVEIVDGQIRVTARYTAAQIAEATAIKGATEEWARSLDVRQRIAAVMVEVAEQQDAMNAESAKIETARNRLVNLTGPREIEQIEAQAAALRVALPEWDKLTGQYRTNTRELDILRRSQELLNQNLGLSSDEVRKLAEAYVDANATLRDATAQTDRTTARMNAAFDELANFGDRAFDRIGQSITDAFAKGEDAMVSFKSIAKAIFSELSQEGLKLFALNPAKNALFGQNNATGGDIVSKLLGGLFGGGGGGGANAAASSVPFFSSAMGFAGGGVPPVGKMSIVGENGPELFVPSGLGRIVPNGGMGGGTVVNMTVVARDVDSFRPAQRQIAVSLGRQLDMRAKNL